MNRDFYRYLCCPDCEGDLETRIEAEDDCGIESGELRCARCDCAYPIVNHIPRFVPEDNYAASFGYQWEKFAGFRYDSYTGSTLIRDTILRRSGWDVGHVRDKLVLECGCGAGHETEVLLDMGAKVLAFDYSNSVDVAWKYNRGRENLLLVQADICNLPLKKGIFDIVFCHRVIQHTPRPERSFYSIAKRVKNNGEMFLHSYSTSLKSMLHYKYFLRPVTKRMSREKLLEMLNRYGPVMYRILGFARKHHLKFLRRIIPFENADSFLAKHNVNLSDEEKFQFSLNIVFDALTPAYDNPSSARTVTRWFKNAGFGRIDVRRKKPVVVVAER